MADTFKHIINMANSIIGVSILSMPYCFKETGLILGVILILFSGFITKKTCMFLIRGAIMSRRRSYESLAFEVFGVTGKLLMELCMILFLIGICISFHVVMGDLAPAIVAKWMAIENSSSLRVTLLVGMVLLVILPLCLLRNLDSLASMSACSIGFYVFLNCVIFYMALPRLLDGSWIHKAELFHLDNAFRVLPIMTLALACQSNVFEIYESIPDPDVPKMRSVVSQAVNICCALYIGVGFLGYVAFVDRDVGGNLIMSFPVSSLTDGITLFFVVSLAISFPLMLFPCRTSLHSLLYKRNTQVSYDLVGNYMPESRFKGITVSVLTVSLIIGILLPNIEFVLGLLGSTMGVIIALILPSVFFIKVYTKTSCDRLLAQGFFLLGVMLMVTGTYLHLSGLQTASKPVEVTSATPIQQRVTEFSKNIESKNIAELPASNLEANVKKEVDVEVEVALTGRKEPAIPEPPSNDKEVIKEVKVKPPLEKDSKKSLPLVGKGDSPEPKKLDVASEPKQEGDRKVVKKVEDEPAVKLVKKDIKEEDLHPDAIKKEEKENAVEEEAKPQQEIIEKKQEEILKKMEHQQKEQKLLLEEQKKILQELKNQKDKKTESEGQIDVPLNRLKEGGNLGALELDLRRNGGSAGQPRRKELVLGSQLKQNQNNNLQNGPVISNNVHNIPSNNNNNDDTLMKNERANDLPVHIVNHLSSNIGIPINNNLANNNVNNGNQDILVNNVMVDNKIRNDAAAVANPINRANKNAVSIGNESPVKNKIDDNISAGVGNDIKLENDLNVSNFEKRDVRPLLSDTKSLNGAIKMDPKPVYKEQKEPPLIYKNSQRAKKVEPDANIPAPLPIQQKEIKVSPAQQDSEIRLPQIDETLSKHDEERRKRDLSPVEETKENGIQNSNRLSFDSDVKPAVNEISSDLDQKAAADAIFETRHLLWVGRRTRRRKRRQEQFPEYTDEM